MEHKTQGPAQQHPDQPGSREPDNDIDAQLAGLRREMLQLQAGWRVRERTLAAVDAADKNRPYGLPLAERGRRRWRYGAAAAALALVTALAWLRPYVTDPLPAAPAQAVRPDAPVYPAARTQFPVRVVSLTQGAELYYPAARVGQHRQGLVHTIYFSSAPFTSAQTSR